MYLNIYVIRSIHIHSSLLHPYSTQGSIDESRHQARSMPYHSIHNSLYTCKHIHTYTYNYSCMSTILPKGPWSVRHICICKHTTINVNIVPCERGHDQSGINTYTHGQLDRKKSPLPKEPPPPRRVFFVGWSSNQQPGGRGPPLKNSPIFFKKLGLFFRGVLFRRILGLEITTQENPFGGEGSYFQTIHMYTTLPKGS